MREQLALCRLLTHMQGEYFAITLMLREVFFTLADSCYYCLDDDIGEDVYETVPSVAILVESGLFWFAVLVDFA